MDKKKLNSLFSEVQEPVILTNGQGQVIYFNDFAQQFFSCTEADSAYPSVFSLFEKDVHNTLRTFMSHEGFTAYGDTHETRTSAFTKSGITRSVSLLISRIPQKGGPIFMIVVDVLQAASAEATDELRYFKLIAEHTDDVVCFYNQNLTFRYLSPSVNRVLGYLPEELIRQDIDVLVHPEDAQRIRELFFRARNEPVENTVCRVKTKEHGYQEVEISFRTLSESPKDILPFLTLLSTIDTRQAASSLSDLPDALLLLNKQDLLVADANDRAVQLLGAPNKAALVGQPLSAFWREAQEALDNFQSQGHPYYAIDAQLTAHRQETFWGDMLVAHWPPNQAQWLLRINDITERKLTEQRLMLEKEQAEQTIQSRENFLSLMSHEIRTPLNAMLGITHLMLESKPREDQKELLQTLEFSSNNLNTLVNDILSYAKLGSGAVTFEQKPFNLLEFVHGVKLTYKSLANAKGVTFRLLLEDEAPEIVVGDVNRLGQILNNLLSNAVKFTQTGQIVLSLYVLEEEDEQYQLLFEIADTGIGVPENKLSTIFDPYQQADEDIARKFGGTGLGLSIVKNLVQLQSGKVEVSSVVGQGTTFKVQLPFAKPSSAEMQQENTPRQLLSEYQSLEGFKVLYVEDVVPNQLLMEGLSNKWKIDLDTALNGLEALEKVKQHHYDLILMDIHMPEMDGYEATAEIRKLHDPHYANIPIIALTASISDKTKNHIQEAGMNDYVAKPINPRDLHRKLYQFSQTALEVLETATEPLAESVDQPNFSQIRDLFVGDNQGYRQLLTQIRELMQETRNDITEATRAGQPEKLHLSIHKIISYTRLLGLERFNQLLTLVKSHVEGQKIGAVEALIWQISTHFDTSIEAIHQEIEMHSL